MKTRERRGGVGPPRPGGTPPILPHAQRSAGRFLENRKDTCRVSRSPAPEILPGIPEVRGPPPGRSFHLREGQGFGDLPFMPASVGEGVQKSAMPAALLKGNHEKTVEGQIAVIFRGNDGIVRGGEDGRRK